MKALIKVLAAVRRVEEAVDEHHADDVRKRLRELRKILHEENFTLSSSPPKEPLEPTRDRLHDVPTLEGTPFERTHTGTFIGRAKIVPPPEDSEDT